MRTERVSDELHAFVRRLEGRLRLRSGVRIASVGIAAGGFALLLLLAMDAIGLLPARSLPLLRWIPPLAIALPWLVGGLGMLARKGPESVVLTVGESDPDLPHLLAAGLALPPRPSGIQRLFAEQVRAVVRSRDPARLLPLRPGRWERLALAASVTTVTLLLFLGDPGGRFAAWGEGSGVRSSPGAVQGIEGGSRETASPRAPWSELAGILRPPAYSGLPERPVDLSEPILALPGSILHLHGEGGDAMPEAGDFRISALVGGEDEGGDLSSSPELWRSTGKGWSSEILLDPRARGVLLEWKPPSVGAEESPVQTRLLTVSLQRDLPPQVTLLAPDEDLVLARPEGEIRLTAEALDDFGVGELRFLWTRTRGGGESFSFQEGEIAGLRSVREGRGMRDEALLDLALLDAAPGDVYHLRAVAWDRNDVTGRGEGVSATRMVRIANPEEAHLVTTLIGFPIEEERDPLLSQRMILLLTEELVETMVSDHLPRPEVVRRAVVIAGHQRRLREQIGEQIYVRATGAMQEPNTHLGYEDHVEEPEHLPIPSGGTASSLAPAHLPDTVASFLRERERREARDHGGAFDLDPVVTGGRSGVDPLSLGEPEGHSHDAAPLIAVNEDLRIIHDLMWEAERELRLGAPDPSRPFQEAVLEEIRKLREAERVFPRGETTVAPIDVAAVRGTGKREGISPLPRRPVLPLPAGERHLAELDALLADAGTLPPFEAARRLTSLALELLGADRASPDAAALLSSAAEAAAEGRTGSVEALLRRVRNLLTPVHAAGGDRIPTFPSTLREGRYRERLREGSEGTGPDGEAGISSPFVFATARYASGNWDSAPLVPTNLIHSLALYTEIEVEPEGVIVGLDAPELLAHPFVFLTGHLPVHFTEAERTNLKTYLERGGFLFIDDHNHDIDGAFHRTVLQEVERLFGPEALRPLPNDHELYRTFFHFEDGPPTTSHELNGWGDGLIHRELLAVEIDGRIALLYSNKDYASEWNYHAVNKRFISLDNTRFGVNVLVYALTR